MQQESEEEDEDQEAREKELQRIHAELQKADDRCMHFNIYGSPFCELCGTLGSYTGHPAMTMPAWSSQQL